MSAVSTSLHLTCLLKMDQFSSAGCISSNVFLKKTFWAAVIFVENVITL